jgi:three-Cys-motif partner protein
VVNEGDLYAGREQTLVKHTILRSYIDRFAHIVGSAWDAITYVDCFSGPWNVQSGDLRDSSFHIALQELRKAKAHLGEALGRDFALRCFFLEKDPEAYQQLDQFARSVRDAEIATRNGALEDSVADILAFVGRRQHDAFPFIFIDPTGWTGFAMRTIAPLLQLRPGEVLINFMTGHILRFAEHPDSPIQQSFDGLFGSSDYRNRIAGLTGQDREDELVRSYCDAVRTVGGYDYVCPAIVLHPENDRTHFHLLYATRHARGVEVFKQAERKAMEVMEKARAEAQQRSRVQSSGQSELFTAETMRDARHYDALRERHLNAARIDVERMLEAKRVLMYDEVWVAALTHPLVWDSDLKAWIAEWSKTGRLGITGLKPRERVPKREAGHQLVWRG